MKYFLGVFLLLSNLFCTAQWNPDTFVNLEVSSLITGDMQSVTTSDGKTWIIFQLNGANSWYIRAQLLDQSGNKLFGTDGIIICEQPTGNVARFINLCLDPSDNLILGFQYLVSGVVTAAITKINTDGSFPWGIGGTLLGQGQVPYPVLLTTGETVIAWDNTSGGDFTLYMQKVDAAGALVWPSPIHITVSGGNTIRAQLVANPGGYFTMLMQKKSGGIPSTLFAQRYNSDGIAQWASPVQISTLSTSIVRYYSIMVSADTTFVGYFGTSGSRSFSYVQRINPDGSLPWGMNGAPFSTYSTGTDPYQQTTNIAFYPGSNVIWATCTYSNTSQSQYGVYVQKFDKTSGAVLLDPLGKEVYPISSNLDTQEGAIGFFSSETPLFLTYDVNKKIKLNALSVTGDPAPWMGFPCEMSSTNTVFIKLRFAFNYNPSTGNAVAAWIENRDPSIFMYKPYAQNRNLFIIPVTLVDFNAVKNNTQVNLYWNTATETANKGFYIERSIDGINFKTLGFINSNAPGGNSLINQDYSFPDTKPLNGYNYYRLKQINIDGKFTYSKTRNIKFDNTDNIYINSIYPSPATNVLHVSVGSSIKANALVNMVDITGKVVNKTSVKLNEGDNSFDIDVSTLSKGIYVLKLVVGGKDMAIRKWTKQ